MKTILFLMTFLSLGSMAQDWRGGPGHLVFSCRGYDQNLNDQIYLTRHQKTLLEINNRDSGEQEYYTVFDSSSRRPSDIGLSADMDEKHMSNDFYYFTGTTQRGLNFPGSGSINFHLYVAKENNRLSHMYVVVRRWSAFQSRNVSTIETEYVFNCAIALN